MAPHDNALHPTPSRAETREYILDMLKQLATMARRVDELELAIQLKALREAARVKRKRMH